MWPFHRSSTLLSSSIFRGLTDWHSHLLPGVDDGVQSLSESLAALAYYEQIGVSEVWLTPHIMEDIPNTSSELRTVFEELKEAYKGSIKLHLASENMIDNLFDQRLEADDLLPLGDNKNLLVETSYFNPPMNFYKRLERIKDCGYTPVLAHPERYVYMGRSDYQRLKSMGILFQLNLPSLSGMYGRQAKKNAEWLLASGFYNLLGTDIHSLADHQQQFHISIKQTFINAVQNEISYRHTEL
jgi:tyrosine-protein phosphatase YwqE